MTTSNVPPTCDEYPRPPDRPYAPTSGGVAAPDGVRVRMPDLVGRVLALCPLSVETLTVTMNDREQESEATIVHVIEIDGDGDAWFDHGEHPVFWRYVRQQLDELASLDHPWVVGTVVKLTRAYSLAAPTCEQLTAGLRAVEAWQGQTRAGTEPR